MSAMPPDNGDADDIDEIYRRWSAADTARPSGAAGKAILANAAALAREAKQRSAQRRLTYRYRTAIFAGLAAAAFSGLLVTPLIFHGHPAAVPASVPSLSLNEPVRQSAAPVAKDTLSRFARSSAKPEPATAPAPLVAASAESLPPAKSFEAKKLSAGLANDAALSAGARAASPTLSELQRVDRDTALRRAATAGDEPGLFALLDGPLDINSRDSDGRTPLMLAVLGGRDNVVALLLAHGADPNVSDAYGATPLQTALTGRHAQIEAALRAAGAR